MFIVSFQGLKNVMRVPFQSRPEWFVILMKNGPENNNSFLKKENKEKQEFSYLHSFSLFGDSQN